MKILEKKDLLLFFYFLIVSCDFRQIIKIVETLKKKELLCSFICFSLI